MEDRSAMEIGAIALLSNGMALQRRLDMTANNLANTTTAGFKREQMVFRTIPEAMADAPADQRIAMLPIDVGRIHDTRIGAFSATGGRFDVAIDGDGWFAIAAPGGTRYTRAGAFRLNESGGLVTTDGLAVLGPGGQPVTVPADAAQRAEVRPDGSIVDGATEVARIGIVRFPDEAQLVQLGDGLWDAPAADAQPAPDARLRPGGIEASNVQPIAETSEMIAVLRNYQTSQRLADGIADLRQRTIERFGRSN